MPERLVIGVDFDNTLAGYDGLLRMLADEEGWLTADVPPHKGGIRDAVRRLPGGEKRWQVLQARAYGSRIVEAVPLAGAREFLARARDAGAEIHVVSHKTMHAAADPDGIDLREAARDWLAANRFFDPPVSLDPTRVHFEPDRASKLRRVGQLGCTHFVDDLEETYLEPSFPEDVDRILLLPGGGASPVKGVTVCRSWEEVGDRILNS